MPQNPIWVERMKEIRVRLSRPEGLMQTDFDRLKVELDAIVAEIEGDVYIVTGPVFGSSALRRIINEWRNRRPRLIISPMPSRLP
jgi:hypothetical protein